MQRLRRLRLRKIKAACFPYATEQAQRQPPETGHRTARPSPSDSTALHGAAAAAVAVMFCCLCVIGTAAAQPGQCPAAWTTAALSVARTYLEATSLPEQGLAIFAGGDTRSLSGSKAVDIFNATSGRWTTAALSVARLLLAATSLPEQGLAIFAGGYVGSLGL